MDKSRTRHTSQGRPSSLDKHLRNADIHNNNTTTTTAANKNACSIFVEAYRRRVTSSTLIFLFRRLHAFGGMHGWFGNSNNDGRES